MSKPRRKTYVSIQSVQSDVTGSRTLVVVTFANGEQYRLLVDCGMYQGCKEEYEKNGSLDFYPDILDVVLLTHAHVDHCGQIPLLYAKGAECDVLMTADTCKISKLILQNTASIVEEGQWGYNLKNLQNTIDHFECVECGKWFRLKDRRKLPVDIFAYFIKNEHCPGAACICIEVCPPGEESFRMFFSGDYNEINAFSEKPTTIPEDIQNKPIAFFMMEATYGRKSKQDVQLGKFQTDVKRYLDTGFSMTITAFAYGRMQNILYEIRRMQDDGRISKELPVYIDGALGIAITLLWKNLENVFVKDFLPYSTSIVSDRQQLIACKKQHILVTTSGMGNFGPAKEYLPAVACNNKMVIYIPSYVSEGSTNRILIQAKSGDTVKINGVERVLEAVVDTTSQFSAHARKEALIDFIRQFKDIRLLEWNHGSLESRNDVNASAQSLENVEISVTVDVTRAIRINADGFVKEYPICSVAKEKEKTRRQIKAEKNAAKPKKRKCLRRKESSQKSRTCAYGKKIV